MPQVEGDVVGDGRVERCGEQKWQGGCPADFLLMALLPVITPPLGLDASKLKDGDPREKQKSFISRLMDLLRATRPGADLSGFRVPPQFNLPKSQLQVYGESVYCCAQDLLSRCADGASALDRFLAVVCWHISTTRPPTFAKAPYNPVLGETHHVTAGALNVLLEQVSHHPPATALYATNEEKKIELLWWHQPVPFFYGSYLEAALPGRRVLVLKEQGERYEATAPSLIFRFLPVPGSEWVGNTLVACPESGLKAQVNFRARAMFGLSGAQNRINGKVWDEQTGQTLYELDGSWDKTVVMKNLQTGDVSSLYDGRAALSGLGTPHFQDQQGVWPLESESVLIWSDLTNNILSRNWERASEEKFRVEEQGRQSRRDVESSGVIWTPKYFFKSPEGNWEWLAQGIPVPKAPIVVD